MKGVRDIFAEYGGIYEWQKDENSDAIPCVVVSSNDRGMNNVISILFLRPYSNPGSDVVAIALNGELYGVHADLVTYTYRTYLVRKIGTMPRDTMRKITLRIGTTLNLVDSGEVTYARLYQDLLDSIVEKGLESEV